MEEARRKGRNIEQSSAAEERMRERQDRNTRRGQNEGDEKVKNMHIEK